MINFDPMLIFECLIYLNIFHYAMIATCDTIMTIAKYASNILPTPHIGRDAAVVFTKLSAELTKIIVFNKYKEKRKRTMIAVALLLTLFTVGTLIYTFKYQDPLVKLDIILNSLTAILIVTEVFFGIWCLLPMKRSYNY